MKAYTNLEQSKKLAKILPLESADMCYRIVVYNPNDTHEYQPYCFSGTLSSDIPCWSLAALLEEMNRNDYNIFLHNNADLTWTISFNDSERYIDVYGDDPVDICFKMILKLNKQQNNYGNNLQNKW